MNPFWDWWEREPTFFEVVVLIVVLAFLFWVFTLMACS